MASASQRFATSRILGMLRYDSRAGAGPNKYASSALLTCSPARSTSEKTATEAMPISRQARMTRTAISPRFAMSTFLNIAETLIVEQRPAASHRPPSPNVRFRQRDDELGRQEGGSGLDSVCSSVEALHEDAFGACHPGK